VTCSSFSRSLGELEADSSTVAGTAKDGHGAAGLSCAA
jgi:hypothetical protein